MIENSQQLTEVAQQILDSRGSKKERYDAVRATLQTEEYPVLAHALAVTPKDGELNPKPEFLVATGATVEEFHDLVTEDVKQVSPPTAA